MEHLPPPPPLGRLLHDARVVLCLGAGGVGKTTLSAALAARLAADGRRVLCLTIDPARRLAENLGIPPGSDDEVPLPADRLAAVGLAPRGTLTFAQLDPARTFDAAVRRSAADPDTARRVMQSRLYRFLAGSLPGMHEFMAMERFFGLRADDRFDLVIHDTPPAANALDFLEAPRRLRDAIDSPFVAGLSGADGFLTRASTTGLRAALRLLGRFTGPGLLDEIAALLADARSVLHAFRHRAAEVDRALRSPEVRFLLVTSPRPQAIDEVVALHERLHALQIPVAAFVVNRVRPRFACTAREEALAAEALSPDLLRRLRANLVVQNRLADEDEAEIHRLVQRCGADHPVYRIPALPRDVPDLQGVSAVAAALFDPMQDPH